MCGGHRWTVSLNFDTVEEMCETGVSLGLSASPSDENFAHECKQLKFEVGRFSPSPSLPIA